MNIMLCHLLGLTVENFHRLQVRHLRRVSFKVLNYVVSRYRDPQVDEHDIYTCKI